MLSWNLFSASSILAAYFATIPDAARSNAHLIDSTTSVFLGILVIFTVNYMNHVLRRKPTYHIMLTLYHSSRLLASMSLFLILCQNIGHRGSQHHTIPVEYAYIPILLVSLMTSIKGNARDTLQTSVFFQCCEALSFMVIVFSTRTNRSNSARIVETLPLFIGLVSLYSIPVEREASNIKSMLISATCKSVVLTVGILAMSLNKFPESSEFSKSHDFYTLRAVAHLDPQVHEYEISPLSHILSEQWLLGQFTKLIYLIQSCISYSELLHLQSFKVSSKNYPNSRHELVIIGTIGMILLSAFCASKQNARLRQHGTHSMAMLWGFITMAIACATKVLISYKPFTDNTLSIAFLRFYQHM
jgi:hypothetical protein